MTTSDLVARLTARANLTYSYPIEDILLLRSAADEIARLREALEEITDAVGSYQTAKDKMLAGSRIAGAWHKARAALAEQKSTQEK